MARIDNLLAMMVEQRGSALHIGANEFPRARVGGALHVLDGTEAQSGDDVRALLREIAGADSWARYETHDAIDFAYYVESIGRFRVHCYHRAGGPAAVVRTTLDLLSGQTLELPATVRRMAHLARGLVIICGPTGAGKSTTLNAIVDEINANHVKHIISIESPIELVHRERQSFFSQREVGEHCMSQHHALRAAMRQTPDVILVESLDSAEAAEAALAAADAGVLVLTTITANGVSRALQRFVGLYSEERQKQAHSRLADNLTGAVSLLLLPSQDDGLCLAAEVLLRARGVPSAIREGDFDQLHECMRLSDHMQTMDDALHKLLTDRRIRTIDAYDHARDKSRFT